MYIRINLFVGRGGFEGCEALKAAPPRLSPISPRNDSERWRWLHSIPPGRLQLAGTLSLGAAVKKEKKDKNKAPIVSRQVPPGRLRRRRHSPSHARALGAKRAVEGCGLFLSLVPPSILPPPPPPVPPVIDPLLDPPPPPPVPPVIEPLLEGRGR